MTRTTNGRLKKPPADTAVATLLSLTESQRSNLDESLIVTVAHLTRLSAYKTWQVTSGKVLQLRRLRRRGQPCMLFLCICEMMIRQGLQFSDADPVGFECIQEGQWETEFGLALLPARALHRSGVLGTQILRNLTDKEINALYRAGAKAQAAIQRLRDELNATS